LRDFASFLQTTTTTKTTKTTTTTTTALNVNLKEQFKSIEVIPESLVALCDEAQLLSARQGARGASRRRATGAARQHGWLQYRQWLRSAQQHRLSSSLTQHATFYKRMHIDDAPLSSKTSHYHRALAHAMKKANRLVGRNPVTVCVFFSSRSVVFA
jgi:hypothetical protein